MKIKIFFLLFSFFFLSGVGFYFLPYNYQCAIGIWPLEVGEEIEKDYGDAILVPGAGCNPGRGTEERLNLASSIYKKKKRKVIISEGYCRKSEQLRFNELMISRWRFDPVDIIWDTLSFNTEENMLHLSQLCERLGLKSAILCTSPHHQLRCKVLLNKYWVGDFQVAKMEDSMLECKKEQVYVNRQGRQILSEYLKTGYQFIFL